MPHTYSISQPTWWVYLLVALFAAVFALVLVKPNDRR